MNTELINKTADIIEQAEHSTETGPYQAEESIRGGRTRYFCMNYDRYKCGSPACIYGYACLLAGEKINKENDIIHLNRLFDLGDEGQAEEIYIAVKNHISLDEITPEWAAAMLRKLVETGNVDWAGTKP